MILLAESFLLLLFFGIQLFSLLAKPDLTGAGFLKLISSLCATGFIIAGSLHYAQNLSISIPLILYFTLFLLSAINYFRKSDHWSVFDWINYFFKNGVAIYLIWSHSVSDPLTFFYLLSSGLFLGVVTYAMVLGHWYLVVPKLTERPLKVACYFLWTIMFVKVASSLIGTYYQGDFFEQNTAQGAGYLFNWLMLTMRWGWGYLVIGVMSYFSWRLINMRSIQSATGMLYAMTFFVLVGELIPQYMFFKYGLYL